MSWIAQGFGRDTSNLTMTMTSTQDEVLISDPHHSIPPLTTKTLTSAPDKVAALKLVADSIAQQRQLAAKAVIFHPLTIAIYILVVAVTSQFLYKSQGDIPVIVTTCAGITMTLLVSVRAWVNEYLSLAEGFNTSFLENDEDGERDTIIGSRFGEEIIGALILRIEKNGQRGLIRAWTTRQKYRGTGVGTELLEEAVRVTREKLGKAAEIRFIPEHANSKMVLPEMFNQGFRRREVGAARALEGVIRSEGCERSESTTGGNKKGR